MTTPDTGDAVARVPRWLYFALIASLAVNLIFVGIAGSAYWHHRKGGHGGFGRGGDYGLMGFARQLPDDRRAVLREDFKAARETLKPMRSAIRDAWVDANKTLAAEPFDIEALKAAMARQTEAETKFKNAVKDAFAESVAKLTAEERRQLYEWREKRQGRMFGKGRRDQDDKDGPPDSE